jgi:hypothetical protein
LSNNQDNKVGNQDNILNVKAVKVYNNLKEDRLTILKEQRDKSGVYCSINKVNGHSFSFLFRYNYKYFNNIFLPVSGFINNYKLSNTFISAHSKEFYKFGLVYSSTRDTLSRLRTKGVYSKKLYSTIPVKNDNAILDPWFVTGFWDGESYFFWCP